MVERKRITCPETGRLEEIDVEHTPFGRIITRCSRYPGGALACPRECARRMDRRARADGDDRVRVLVVLARLHDDAARVGSALAASLAEDGLTVEIAELGARPPPPLEDYDAVVIGARARFGWHARAVIEYIRVHRAALAAIPAFFYSVGGRGVFARGGDVRRMTWRAGWRPVLATSFGHGIALPRADIQAFARQIAEAIPPAPQPGLR